MKPTVPAAFLLCAPSYLHLYWFCCFSLSIVPFSPHHSSSPLVLWKVRNLIGIASMSLLTRVFVRVVVLKGSLQYRFFFKRLSSVHHVISTQVSRCPGLQNRAAWRPLNQAGWNQGSVQRKSIAYISCDFSFIIPVVSNEVQFYSESILGVV